MLGGLYSSAPKDFHKQCKCIFTRSSYVFSFCLLMKAELMQGFLALLETRLQPSEQVEWSMQTLCPGVFRFSFIGHK